MKKGAAFYKEREQADEESVRNRFTTTLCYLIIDKNVHISQCTGGMLRVRANLHNSCAAEKLKLKIKHEIWGLCFLDQNRLCDKLGRVF